LRIFLYSNVYSPTFVYRAINPKKIKDFLIDSCSTTDTVIFRTTGAALLGYPA